MLNAEKYYRQGKKHPGLNCRLLPGFTFFKLLYFKTWDF